MADDHDLFRGSLTSMILLDTLTAALAARLTGMELRSEPITRRAQ